MKTSLRLFFELLLVSVGRRESLSHNPTDAEWADILQIARKHALVGVCFGGMESLPAQQRPSSDMVITWYANSGHVEAQARLNANLSKEALGYFRNNGFKALILKGFSIAQLYPNPERRACGDIDLWLDGGRERIYDYARKNDENGRLYGVNYHHVHYHLFDDVEVELHIYPAYFENPFINRRFQSLCNKYLPDNSSDVPSMAFNRIFILTHSFNHLVGHGLGLRQVMDYYYVLLQGFTDEEKSETIKTLKQLKLTKFAAAMMWILQKCFGLEEEKLLLEPNEKEGKFILDDICQTGNMGHYDKRNWGSTRTPFSRFIFNLRRGSHFFLHYPSHIMWQPIFSIWLFLWRWRRGLLS